MNHTHQGTSTPPHTRSQGPAPAISLPNDSEHRHHHTRSQGPAPVISLPTRQRTTRARTQPKRQPSQPSANDGDPDSGLSKINDADTAALLDSRTAEDVQIVPSGSSPPESVVRQSQKSPAIQQSSVVPQLPVIPQSPVAQPSPVIQETFQREDFLTHVKSLTVKNFHGPPLQIGPLAGDESVADIKRMIQDMKHFNKNGLRIYWGGKLLENSKLKPLLSYSLLSRILRLCSRCSSISNRIS